MVVHTALAALLARLTATGDIMVGTLTAGRGQAALDPLIGMFVNTLVLRTAVDTGKPFASCSTRCGSPIWTPSILRCSVPNRSSRRPGTQRSVRAPRAGDALVRPDRVGGLGTRRDLRSRIVAAESRWLPRSGTCVVVSSAPKAGLDRCADVRDRSVRRADDEHSRRQIRPHAGCVDRTPTTVVGDVDLSSDDPARFSEPARASHSYRTFRCDSGGFVHPRPAAAHGDSVAVPGDAQHRRTQNSIGTRMRLPAGLISRGTAIGDLVGVATARTHRPRHRDHRCPQAGAACAARPHQPGRAPVAHRVRRGRGRRPDRRFVGRSRTVGSGAGRCRAVDVRTLVSANSASPLGPLPSRLIRGPM